MPATNEELLETFRQMTLLELSEFVKQFEDTFGVTAAAPAMVVPGTEMVPAEEAVPEQTEFTVVLESAGERKIQVIKEVRVAVPGLGLKDAKDLVDSAPKVLLEGVDGEKAQKAREVLERAGAVVTVR